jgi:hypothetical protein
MIVRMFLFITVALISGCGGPTFTDLGNGVGVPSESIESHAQASGISRDEARYPQ